MASNHRLQRLHCYLCDLPRTPWSILGDFSEAICRGCCNYEGADRIEEVIEYARNLRKAWDHQLRVLKTQCLTSSGASVGSSPSPNSASSVNGVVEANGVAYHPMAVGLPYPHLQRYPRGITDEDCSSTQSATVSQSENGVRREQQLGTIVKEPNNNNNYHDVEQRRNLKPMDTKQEVLSPQAAQPPYANYARQQQEFQELPVLVRETLGLLNSFVPFDVRFKKDHNLVARVFAFEAASRTSGNNNTTEHELKIFAEYPRGSGNVFQSASAVAKQMYSDCMKDLGRGLSSGFKYLEYEVHNSKNEWKLLGELLPEQVRYFREPLDRDGFPVRVTDAQMVQFGIPVAVGADGMVCPPLPPGGRVRKRKAADETNDLHAVNNNGRTPRKTYKEREDEQMQRHLWMQSQVDSLRLSMAHLTGQRNHVNMYRGAQPQPPPPGGIAMVRGHPPPIPPQQQHPSVPHGIAPNSKSHPRNVCHQPQASSPSTRGGPPWSLPSSMAALISAAGSVDAGAMHPNGPNSSDSTTYLPRTSDVARAPRPTQEQNGKDRPEMDRVEPKETTTVDSLEKIARTDKENKGTCDPGSEVVKASGPLKCYICSDLLEDTHFVQCPAVGGHKFCFPCSKSSIKQQGAGTDVFCPSGKQCPLVGSNLPWAFMQSEIQTILATDNHPHVKKEKVTDKVV